jgi:hypothetical protein
MPTAFYADRLSEHLGVSPEGYLVCLGAKLARSGFQRYHGSELGLKTDDFVDCYRPPDEVLDKSFIASLNGKPVTDNHPATFLNAQNASWFTKGHVQNPRVGGRLENGDQVVEGDLIITDPQLIERIRSGAVRELSCGYEFQLVETDDGYEQHRLRGNHVACVPSGRAGHDIKILDATYLPKNFADIVRRFLGRNPTAVATETNHRTCDEQRGPIVNKQELKQAIREVLDEREAQFARDSGVEVDDQQLARSAKQYLGKPLPRLGESRNEPEPDKRRTRHVRDAAAIASETFERNCRELRLKLQRGEK